MSRCNIGKKVDLVDLLSGCCGFSLGPRKRASITLLAPAPPTVMLRGIELPRIRNGHDSLRQNSRGKR